MKLGNLFHRERPSVFLVAPARALMRPFVVRRATRAGADALGVRGVAWLWPEA
jgi:hypothetical protein